MHINVLVRYIGTGCIFCAPSGLRQGQVFDPPPPPVQMKVECPPPRRCLREQQADWHVFLLQETVKGRNIVCLVQGHNRKYMRIITPVHVKLFIPLQFRTPVGTHLHTANQRPRVLICIQPIHRGWFNPRYILVRPPLLLSTARGAVGKATCSTAWHCLFSGCEFKSSCWLFFFCYNKMGNNGVYSVRGDTQMMK